MDTSDFHHPVHTHLVHLQVVEVLAQLRGFRGPSVFRDYSAMNRGNPQFVKTTKRRAFHAR